MRGSSSPPRAVKLVREQGAPRIDPSNPNSRRGRNASPLRQGRDKMEITVGIDVSKARLDVHVHPAGESFAVGNDEAAVQALGERLGQLDGLVRIGIEATGRHERLAVAHLAAAGLPVVVVNPAQVRAYAQAIGQRAKTDPIDARLIALFVEAVRPEVRPMPDTQTLELAALMARRRQIVNMLAAEKARRQQADAGPARVSIARSVTFLTDELKSLDLEIDKTVRGTPVWRDKEDLLSSVPVSARPSPAHSWPNYPSLAPSLPSRPPPWWVLLLTRVSRAGGVARASSAAVAPRLEAPSTWAPWLQHASIQLSKPSATNSLRQASQNSSPSSPSPGSSSLSSTPSCATQNHGEQLDQQDSRSPMGGMGSTLATATELIPRFGEEDHA